MTREGEWPVLQRITTVCLLLLSAVPCFADGVMMGKEGMPGREIAQSGVSSPHQKAVIIQPDPGTEILLLQTTYQGPAAEFAWVIPVPGLPTEEDVFRVGGEIIPWMLDETAPQVHSRITVQKIAGLDAFGLGVSGMAVDAAEAPPPGGMEGIGDAVTVHARMEVGDYDAAVLSSRRADALTTWLRQNGYHIPDGSDDVVAHYVGKGWYFVALKVLPKLVADRPVMNDMHPIGIRFRTDRLVFPLRISRLSAPQKTAIALVILAGGPRRCDQLPWAPLRETAAEMQAGTSYATIRRSAVERQAPSAVLERVTNVHGVPVDAAGLSDDSSAGPFMPGAESRTLTATRLWTILDREQLDDLAFSPLDGSQATPFTIEREGLAGVTFGRTPFALPLAVLIFVLAVVLQRVPSCDTAWQTRAELICGALLFVLFSPWLLLAWIVIAAYLFHGASIDERLRATKADALQQSEPTARPRPGPLGVLGWAFVVAGFIAWTIKLTTDPHQLLFHPGTVGPAVAQVWYCLPEWLRSDGMGALLSLAWLFVACVLMTREVRTWPREAVRAARTPEVIAAAIVLTWLLPAGVPLIALGAEPWSPVSILGGIGVIITAIVYGALFGFGLVAASATARSRTIMRALAHAVMVIGLIAAGEALVLRAEMPDVPSVTRSTIVHDDVASALGSIDSAIERFRGDTGCYPAALADLTAQAAPATGRDASGNEMALSGTWHGPYIKTLPVDPLTRSRQTWVYEPTGDPVVDSGGWMVRLKDD